MVDYTTTELINAIKRRGMLPTNQSTFTNALFLEMANDELQTRLVPLLVSLGDEYLVTFEDTTMTSAVRYQIPDDAYNSKLRDMTRLESDGTELEIAKVEPEFAREGYYEANSSLDDFFYYVEGDDIVLYPNSDSGNTLRMYYYRRPNKLVRVIESGKITAINTGTGQLTLDNVPAAWSTSNTFDVINYQPPFETKLSNQTASAVSSPTVTLSDVSDLVVGDYVALTDESPIPQIPVETHVLLAQATVIACLESLGDINGSRTAEQKYERLKDNFLNTVSSRVKGDPKRIVSRDKLLNYIRGRYPYYRWRG